MFKKCNLGTNMLDLGNHEIHQIYNYNVSFHQFICYLALYNAT